jgi:alpha-tubulin suppressor-like RCC1 family protein
MSKSVLAILETLLLLFSTVLFQGCQATDNVNQGSSATVVYRWGSYRSPGEGIEWDSKLPVQVPNIQEVVSLSTGGHCLVAKSDGTVWAWGANAYGQLGDGSTTSSFSPVQVNGIENAIVVEAGDYHSLALKSDGTVWAWGKNDKGQLGSSTKGDSKFAVQVQALTSAIAIAAGANHSLALTSDGSVWSWGLDDSYQLGATPYGTGRTWSSYPHRVDLSQITAISASLGTSLALKSDGTVWAWGSNQFGYSPSPQPSQIMGLSGISGMAAGSIHSIALKNDGTVWAWGENNHGQLGNGTISERGVFAQEPVQVKNLKSVKKISSFLSHNLALLNDGTVWAWGSNFDGCLGDGSGNDGTVPVKIVGLKGIRFVDAGNHNSIAMSGSN